MYHFFGILFLYVFISASVVYPDNYWLRQQSPTTKWLYKCHFTDSLYGWAAGDSGIIIHTSNGGGIWTIQNSTINYFIEDLFFLNRRLGWAIANDFFYFGTTILKTTNGGMNWNFSRYPDTTLVLNTIYFLDSLNGWMGGFEGVILRTTNGGVNWGFRTVDSTFCSFFPVRQFAFYLNSVRAFACGGYFDVSGVIWRTTNSGLFWMGECVSFEPINDIIFLDSLRAIGVGGDFEYG
ncbi:MAG: WD40/YVTN/BNR-like repeat-containing protein, partial [Ignavibacteria bacterium]